MALSPQQLPWDARSIRLTKIPSGPSCSTRSSSSRQFSGQRVAMPQAFSVGSTLAALLCQRLRAKRRRRRPLTSLFDGFLTSETYQTSLPSEVKLGKLLTWARKQDSMKLHPCLTIGQSQLQLSVPVAAGTPIIGVLEDAFLGISDGREKPWQRISEAARNQHPEWWSLHLGINVVKECLSPSSELWEAYIKSVAPQPASALFWSPPQAQQLQDAIMKKKLQSRIKAIQDFHKEVVVPAFDDVPAPSDFEVAQGIVTAASRGIEVRPGRRALLPLLDLVGPPEATVLAGTPAESNCELQIERKGGPGGKDIAILLASRDLKEGEKLCRPMEIPPDDLLLDHGLSTTRPDDVTIHVGLKKGVVQPWQLSTLRKVMDLAPDNKPGDWVASAKVRRSSTLIKTFDPKLLAAARVLSGKSREDVLGAEWNLMSNEEMLNSGLEGLSATHRRRALWVLKQAVEGALASYETTLTEDEEVVQQLEGRERAALAYRIGKKRVLQDAREKLEKADEKIRIKRARREKESSLPTAVTGKRASTAGMGFG
ncbi:unnamed protein product [Durusdinium trenchii]|uniref:Uncharacterized protein n=2 Tax=Durusdinium trenchii TaxID=1381693 RepID=A0ABP0NTQ0_9DINO